MTDPGRLVELLTRYVGTDESDEATLLQLDSQMAQLERDADVYYDSDTGEFVPLNDAARIC